MSNSPVKSEPMRLSALHLAGEGTWADLTVRKLSPQLNLFYGPPRTGKSSLAQLIGHLLFGKTEHSWRRQFGQSVAQNDGSISLDGPAGEFVLRRHYDVADRHGTDRQCRLTIASGRGDAVDGHTIQNLLSGLTPELASRVYAVDFAESPRADWLLSSTFAREFGDTHPTESHQVHSHSYSSCDLSERGTRNHIDTQRVEELVKRRDSIAGEIQQQMAVRRSESEVLEREILELDATRDAKRKQLEHLRIKLHSLDTEIAEFESRLRYHTLDEQAKHRGQAIDVEGRRQQLTDIDEEITRCRNSLADTQRREQYLRAELAQYGSDGTADSVTCLADGRATLGVLERLIDDLDAEVALLARTHEPGRCIGHDSHAKLNPVASLLRQQVYTLCGQFTEQERIVRRQQLTAESQQLARVHSELGARLDLLLSQRESLIQESQLVGQHTRLIPQPPAVDHCQCDHHGEFVQMDDSMVLGRADRSRHEADARKQLDELHLRRHQLLDEYNGLRGEIEQLDAHWERLQSERAGLISGASIEQRQAELDRLEAELRQSLAAQTSQPVIARRGVWRASDILAQLSDGNLTQIRVDRQQSLPTLIDRRGQMRSLESLSASEHDQLYLALTLALVSSYAQRGIALPLVLDEPFLNQSAVQAATMIGVLDQFARAGHQLFVFTEDYEVSRRCSTLAASVYELESLRHIAVPTPAKPAPPKTTVQTASTRIVRETYGGKAAPTLRLAPTEGDAAHDDEFYLIESSSFGDFPVLGADTDRLFAQIEIFTVADLLATDAATVASRLGREGITADMVELWQIHMALMCHIPNLTLNDAQLLSACGIDSPADLFDANLDRLLDEIAGFLRSERGQRFARLGNRYTRSRLGGWRDGARRYRDRWQRSHSRYSNWGSRKSRLRTSLASSSTSTPPRASSTKSRKDTRQRNLSSSSSRAKKFYLSRQDDVEAAPSIGPKTASRLAKVGIRTVADLLNADPDSTAAELDVSHITAETIAEWQHQARLVCQIPRLRGYGSQLLVACGLTQPEQIAGIPADQLVAQVLAYCETKEGQRILRSADPPKVEKIAEWVELAALSRPLEAA